MIVSHAVGTADARVEEVFTSHLRSIQREADRLLAWLLAGQWAFAVVCAVVVSPYAWAGQETAIHVHVWAAILLGGMLCLVPGWFAMRRPGYLSTRLILASAQVLFSALLIHLMAGRIEAHFHVFGSLAILAFYRDWRVFVPAVSLVLADHLVRGVLWPESAFGVLSAAHWRAFEHGAWVCFETVFLLWGIAKGQSQLLELSKLQLALTNEKTVLEERVRERTTEIEEQGRHLAQAQKLESIGHLAAGIAHEINTPMQCVSGNVEFLKNCYERLFSVVDTYRNQLDGPDRLSWSERREQMERLISESRYDFVRKQVPDAIEEAADAVERVIETVRAMKVMSHPGTQGKVSTDVNELVRNAAIISRNRWKYSAKLILELEEPLPDVRALPAELSQALLNLIVNAADAVTARFGEESNQLGAITVRTRSEDDGIGIEVEDTGCGIPDDIKHRVFDPFFTTKDVGKGTGQGLAITHDVVVHKHQGRIRLKSTVGHGTTFLIWIPCQDFDSAEPTEVHADLVTTT